VRVLDFPANDEGSFATSSPPPTHTHTLIVNQDVLTRLEETFKRTAPGSGYLPQVTFSRDVLGETVPTKLTEVIRPLATPLYANQYTHVYTHECLQTIVADVIILRMKNFCKRKWKTASMLVYIPSRHYCTQAGLLAVLGT